MANKKLRAIRVEGNLAYVPLTRGYEAIIDASDVALVENYNWQAFVRPRKSAGVYPIYAASYTLSIDGPRRKILMHRVINPTPKGMVVDHINGDGLDNRRQNLRTVTQNQNIRNRRPREDGVSFGVRERGPGKWAVYWRMSGFPSRDAAVEAREQLNRFMDGMNYPRRHVQQGQSAVVHGRK